MPLSKSTTLMISSFLIVYILLLQNVFAENQNPKGWLDAADCDSFRGWTCDPDNYSASISVHFYKEGNISLGSTIANLQREQAVGNECGGYTSHGFVFNTPSSVKDEVQHTIYAYAINTPSGTNPQLSGSPKILSPCTNISQESAVIESKTFYHTAIAMKAYYPTCVNTPVNFSIYYWINNQWEWHNTCYANNKNDPNWPGGISCQFKYPLPIDPNTKAMIRTQKVNTDDCSYNTDYDDTIVQGAIIYPPYKDYSSVITVDKPYYKVMISRNGGAVYELYNKRSDSQDNTIHMHMGAALQIAIHSGGIHSLTTDPCTGQGGQGGQGYWNPTQAGAACSYRNGVKGGVESPTAGTYLDVYCDGVKNNVCTSASNSIFFPLYPMMNWDYGPSYEGPYNANDTSLLEENISLQNSYIQFDMKLQNKGSVRSGLIEMPTYYFSNKYRRCYYFSIEGLKKVEIPLSLVGLANASYGTGINNAKNFVTCENPNIPNSAITIAWFSSTDFYDRSSSISETEYFKEIKFNEVQSFTFANKIYNLRFLIIPFKFDEIIDTEFGRMTVENLINLKNISTICNQDGTNADGFCNSRCGASIWCNLRKPFDGIPYCGKGGNPSVHDRCSATCQPEDRPDQLCRKIGISDCQGDIQCDGIKVGTNNCDINCKYITTTTPTTQTITTTTKQVTTTSSIQTTTTSSTTIIPLSTTSTSQNLPINLPNIDLRIVAVAVLAILVPIVIFYLVKI